MSSIFHNTQNTRPIFPDSFRFIRSDVPTIVTEEEAIWLIDHSIITPNEKYIEEFLHWYDGK